MKERWVAAGIVGWMQGKGLVAFEPGRLTCRADGSTALDDVRWLLGGLHANPALWLVLWGERGRGKTHLALGLSMEACRSGSVLFLTGRDMLLLLRQAFGGGGVTEGDMQARLTRPMLLVLDDVGTERLTDYTAEAYWAVLNARYMQGKALVVTTNLDPDRLMAHVGEAAASRMSERALLSEVVGADYRAVMR